ncbi:MAG: Gfo/Idh/MocA family oxidoreductase [Clostridiales bacterium]|nr:Gfo/Idh/MocA family oxidoreductase [Clostridiales bacterium]
MKQSTVLVGGGVIARHYREGLGKSKTLRLDALVDKNPNCVARECFSVPFFTDLNDALTVKPRIAILALPVAARGDVARVLLSKGVAVLTEKPMFDSLEEIAELVSYAQECGTPLACLFHWEAADEVRFLKANLDRFGKINAISTIILDDYAATDDGTIRQDRLGLAGAWIDSGINVLSYYDEIIDLSAAVLREQTLIPDSASRLPKYAHKVFDASGIRAEITVDWRTPSREKTSRIDCEKGTVLVNHTAQTVSLNGEIIFERKTCDRLSSHYENLFAELSAETLASSQETTIRLHKLLYKGNAK